MICEGKSIDKRSRAHVIRNTKTATDPCCAACKTVLTIDNNVGRVWPSWELFGFLAKREDHYVFMMSWCPLRTMTLYSFYTNTFKGFWWTLGTVISQKNELFTLWANPAKLEHGEGNRIRQKIRIDVKTVLPLSDRLHKFHSMGHADAIAEIIFWVNLHISVASFI